MASRDERIWLITGDVGYGVVDAFAQSFPERYLNAGIAEQNMIGIATGLALSGKIPVVYSIANFPIFRCLEQIRNDVCYHSANVKIVTVGGGLAYGPLGYTHHGIEDLAVMRALPNMVVIAPADPVETKLATVESIKNPGPVFLRLGKAGEPTIHEQEPKFNIGQSITLREGKDLSLIGAGNIMFNVLAAAKVLADWGIDARVLSMHSIHPLDENAIKRCWEETAAIITVEEHGFRGGLGSAVAEVIAENGHCYQGNSARFKRIAIANQIQASGTQEWLQSQNGLLPQQIAQSARQLLENK